MPDQAPADPPDAEDIGGGASPQDAIESLPMMVWRTDPAGRAVRYNRGFAEFVGPKLKQDSMAGWLDAIHRDDQVKWRESFERAVRTQSGFERKYRMKRRDGELRWIVERGAPIEINGECAGFAGFCFDATDTHADDGGRRDIEDQVRLLTLATHDMVWCWDGRMGRVIHNSTFTESIGEAPGPLEPTLAWWRQRVHADDRERVARLFETALHSEATDISAEYRIRRRNGSWMHVDDRACLVRNGEGAVVRVLGSMRDISLRKAAEQERERFVRILEATTDVVGMSHPNGNIIHLNAAGRRLLGWPLTGPLAEFNISQCHPDWANEIILKEGIPEAITAGAWSGETALQNAEGGEVPVLQVILSHVGADGQVEFISTIMRDISERKRLEVARIEDANRYDAAIRSSRQLLFDWNSFTGDVTYAGDLEHILGYSRSEMAGGMERFREIVHTDDLAAFDEEITRVTSSRDPFRLTFRAVRKDASEIVIDAKGHFFLDRLGHFGRMVGFLADVTSERRAQETLERAHEVLEHRVAERTTELAQANMVIHDRARQQETVARLGQKALAGTKLAELFANAAKLVQETLNVDVCSVFELADESGELVLAGGAGWPKERTIDRMPAGPYSQSGYTLLLREPVISEDLETETRFPISEDARAIDARSAASVIIQTAAAPFGVLVMMSREPRRFRQEDVHFLQSVANVLTGAINRQRAEESIRLAHEQAESANRAKSEFLSRMSHELRTPLNAIIGFTQLLQMEQLTPGQTESVSHIARGGEHLLALINQVLDIARIDTGRLPMTIEPVSIGLALRETVELIQPLADRQGIVVKIDASCGDEVCVGADRQRLRQVFMNLLSNAVKYNRPHGFVKITAETEGSRVRVRIADSGSGIPPEKITRLFVPFERLGAESTQIDGTGTGLALAQRIVSTLEGSLTVKSVVGEGSVFTVELPSAVSEMGGAASVSPTEAGEQTRTLLYIEDQDLNLRLVERILKRIPDLRLISAMQGSIGIELAREHRPHLILLDLNLPDMGGEEVLRRVKADPNLRAIPVIMVSADALGDRITQLMSQGANGYITKPYKVDDFVRTIRDALAAAET